MPSLTDIDTAVRERYSSMRTRAPEGTPITVLHIGGEGTGVAIGSGVEPDATLTLRIGSKKTARDHFRHGLPTAVELENAIATVEDEIAPVRDRIASGSTLVTTDIAIREIARIAGVAENAEMTLTLEALEQIFQRLAAVTLGRPASRERFPSSAEFAATLLILREFMHHMRFASVTIRA